MIDKKEIDAELLSQRTSSTSCVLGKFGANHSGYGFDICDSLERVPSKLINLLQLSVPNY